MISHLVLFGGRDLLVDLRIIGRANLQRRSAWGMQPNNGGQAQWSLIIHWDDDYCTSILMMINMIIILMCINVYYKQVL